MFCFQKLLKSCSESTSFGPKFIRWLSTYVTAENESKTDGNILGEHYYRKLFPWKNIEEFSKCIASSTIINEDGLIAINKPYGIKLYNEDKPGGRSAHNTVVSSFPVCKYTIYDSLPYLKDHYKVHNLNILRSAERYSSGIVLLSTNEKIKSSVKRSFGFAKSNKIPYLTHWIVTLGYPVVPYRKERVGLKFLQTESDKTQPIILTEFSKRLVKLKKIHPVHAEYRVIAVNEKLATSLVQVSTTSTRFYFLRIYAASRISTILGDVMYSNRMNTLLGVPVHLHIEQAQAFDMQPLPEPMAKVLNVSKGVQGHSSIPTMLHLKSVLLPSYRDKGDLLITSTLPPHFQWTAEQLNLLCRA